MVFFVQPMSLQLLHERVEGWPWIRGRDAASGVGAFVILSIRNASLVVADGQILKGSFEA